MTGTKIQPENGKIHVSVKGNFGEIWVPESALNGEPVTIPAETDAAENDVLSEVDIATMAATSSIEPLSEIPQEVSDETNTSTKPDVSDIPEKKDTKVLELNKPYEEMSVEELQAAILEKLAKNGPVTDQMRKDVMENVYPNSLLNWVKSFH